MKLKYLITSIFVVFLFLASRTNAFADCEIADNGWNENTRSLQVCVGQFNSPTELRGATAHYNCLDNSNLFGGICSGITGPTTYDLSSVPDSQINQDSNGKYYTCFTAVGINRAIGKMNISFTGTQNCTTADLITQPKDWDFLTEGLPWQKGTTEPIKEGSVYCPDKKSINTALGCISFDATGGGFIKSLLGIIIGLGGGFALLLILYGVFIVTTSAGIPEKLKEGKELITSAIAGLLFIIMAIFLMNLIGIQLLAIPGLQ